MSQKYDHEDITTHKMLKLIAEIMDCVENENGEKPECTILSEDLMMIEFDSNTRFRIVIQDTKRFQ